MRSRLFKVFRRALCALLSCLLLWDMAVYASVPEGIPPVATASDLPDSGIQDWDGMSVDPLAGVSDEGLERYYQTFEDYPLTLIQPEGGVQPYIAVTLGAAAIFVFKLIAAAAGLWFAVKAGQWLGSDLHNLMSDYERYIRMYYPDNTELHQAWQDIQAAEWGDELSGLGLHYAKFKEYCERLEGYGTGAPSFSVDVASADPIVSDGLYDFGIYDGEFVNVTSPVYGYSYTISDSADFVAGIFFVSSGSFAFMGSGIDYVDKYGSFYIKSVLYGKAFDPSCLDAAPFFSYLGVFDGSVVGYRLAREIFKDGFVLGDSQAVSISPEKIFGDLEMSYYDFAPSISIPASEADAESVLANVAAATNAAEMSKALEGTWPMGDVIADEDEEVYPWVPGITGWLEKLAQGIEGIRDKVTAIPDALADILDGVVAIPGQIADFFTLDSTAVSTAFASLSLAFKSRFSGLEALSGIFNRDGRSFDDTPPVFTMPVPDALKFAISGETMVIMDLRQHAAIFQTVRAILSAVLWVWFAVWLLDQFDVKFHIG